MQAFWLFTNFLPSLGFLLALILLLHLLKERRSPTSTIAWLLAVVFFPYAGVPLYIIFGGRKMRRMSGRKEIVPISDETLLGRDDVVRSQGEREYSQLFPFRPGNMIEVVGTGEDSFRLLKEHIEHAKHSIYITTFILGKDETGAAIIELLTRKAREGVRICLLMDAVGSRGVSDGFLSGLHAAGGEYDFFMPMLHIPFRGRANLRNHRKMIIIDGSTAIIGGMNLAHEYMGERPDMNRWHDLSILLRGPVVADLITVFRSDWMFTTGKDIDLAGLALPRSEFVGDTEMQLVPSGPDIADDSFYDIILTAVFNARKRIWIVTPYFIPDEMLVTALCIAARRSVDVRVVVPEVSNHRLADMVRRSYLQQIQDAGVQVNLYHPGMVHGKVILFDDSLGVVGSMNMDMRSFFLNYEIALQIHSETIVTQLESWVSQLMNDSLVGIRKSSFPYDYVEGFARLLAPLL